jgi:hypothetical protein
MALERKGVACFSFDPSMSSETQKKGGFLQPEGFLDLDCNVGWVACHGRFVYAVGGGRAYAMSVEKVEKKKRGPSATAGAGDDRSEQLNSNGWPRADSNCRLRLINSIGGAGNNHCCITADGRHCLTAGYANQLLSALPIRADGGFECDGETAALPPDSVVLSSLPAGRSCGTLRCVCLPLHRKCQLLFALS